MSNLAPIPWSASVVQLDPVSGKPLPQYGISKEFGVWLQTAVVGPVANTPQFFPAVSQTSQSAAIGTTPIPLPSISSGAYRVNYYIRKTTADGVSSSLTITFSWTESSQALSLSGPALVVDAVTAVQSGTFPILSDAASPISYSVAYASNTPGQMKYRVYILLETL
jgi:hypothetical protein